MQLRLAFGYVAAQMKLIACQQRQTMWVGLVLGCAVAFWLARDAAQAGQPEQPKHAKISAGTYEAVTSSSPTHLPTSYKPDQPLRVLVLRSGEVFEGQILREEDAFVVTLARGQIRIPAKDVEFCCQSLQDAYECKRAVADPQSAEARLALAEWCLRHGLLEPAEEELNAARELDPRIPRLELIERRLELARSHLPRRAAEESLTRPTEDLDRLLSGLPPHALEAFTQRIQPLLLNRCGTAGCHGPQSSATLKLLRHGPGKPASRRLTQRNLLATTEFIDWTDWQLSPLLEHAASLHGGCKAAPLGGVQSKQYQELAKWVEHLATGTAPADSGDEQTPPQESSTHTGERPQEPLDEPLETSEPDAGFRDSQDEPRSLAPAE